MSGERELGPEAKEAHRRYLTAGYRISAFHFSREV